MYFGSIKFFFVPGWLSDFIFESRGWLRAVRKKFSPCVRLCINFFGFVRLGDLSSSPPVAARGSPRTDKTKNRHPEFFGFPMQALSLMFIDKLFVAKSPTKGF